MKVSAGREAADVLQYEFPPARNNKILYLQLLSTLSLRGERLVGLGVRTPQPTA